MEQVEAGNCVDTEYCGKHSQIHTVNINSNSNQMSIQIQPQLPVCFSIADIEYSHMLS